MNARSWVVSVIGGMLLLNLWGCAESRYEQRAEGIKEQVASFYGHLETREAEAAIMANQRIEQVALESEEYLLRRVGQMSQADRTQEWKIIKTAKETAAENWLALAQYFTRTKEYERARGTYQRVLETYSDPAYRRYQDRAKAGLRDLELMVSPEFKS